MYNFSNQPLSVGIFVIRWYFPAFYYQFGFHFYPHWNMQIYGDMCNQLYTEEQVYVWNPAVVL